MKLYETTEQILRFNDLCENGAIPEEAAKDTLESMNMEFDEKADNIACLIKNNSAESKALKEEANNLHKRANARDKANSFLIKYLHENMVVSGKEKIETTRNKITRRKNPESVELDNNFISWATSNADHLLKYKEPMPDKIAIKEILKSGKELPHAKLIQTERLDIK